MLSCYGKGSQRLRKMWVWFVISQTNEFCLPIFKLLLTSSFLVRFSAHPPLWQLEVQSGVYESYKKYKNAIIYRKSNSLLLFVLLSFPRNTSFHCLLMQYICNSLKTLETNHLTLKICIQSNTCLAFWLFNFSWAWEY